jgi:hypothetical protein
VLSRVLGFNQVTTTGGTRPWYGCDEGCCTLSSPSTPVVTCPAAACHTYLLVAKPPGNGMPARNVPYEIYSLFEALPSTTVHYNAQALNPWASTWVTVIVLTGDAVKTNRKTVQGILKKAGKGFALLRVLTHCDLCGDYVTHKEVRRGHNTHACPEREKGDPNKMVVDSAAILYRGKKALAMCKKTEDDSCTDPLCKFSHHGCSVTQTKERADGSFDTHKELLTRPRTSKQAKDSTAAPTASGPIEIPLGGHLLRPVKEESKRKIKDLTAKRATPISGRDIFRAAEKGSPAVSLQTGASEDIHIFGKQACCPNVFANTDAMLRCSPVQALLGGAKMGEEALIIPCSTKPAATIAKAMGYNTVDAARGVLLAHPRLAAVAAHFMKREVVEEEAIAWATYVQPNTMDFVLGLTAASGTALVVYDSRVEYDAALVCARVNLVVYGDLSRPILFLYQRRDTGRLAPAAAAAVAAPIGIYSPGQLAGPDALLRVLSNSGPGVRAELEAKLHLTNKHEVVSAATHPLVRAHVLKLTPPAPAHVRALPPLAHDGLHRLATSAGLPQGVGKPVRHPCRGERVLPLRRHGCGRTPSYPRCSRRSRCRFVQLARCEAVGLQDGWRLLSRQPGPQTLGNRVLRHHRFATVCRTSGLRGTSISVHVSTPCIHSAYPNEICLAYSAIVLENCTATHPPILPPDEGDDVLTPPGAKLTTVSCIKNTITNTDVFNEEGTAQIIAQGPQGSTVYKINLDITANSAAALITGHRREDTAGLSVTVNHCRNLSAAITLREAGVSDGDTLTLWGGGILGGSGPAPKRKRRGKDEVSDDDIGPCPDIRRYDSHSLTNSGLRARSGQSGCC